MNQPGQIDRTLFYDLWNLPEDEKLSNTDMPANSNNFGPIGSRSSRANRSNLENNTSQMPLQNNTSQMPLQNSTYQMPLQNSTYQMPQQNSTYQMPPQSSSYQMPLQNRAYQMAAPNSAYQMSLPPGIYVTYVDPNSPEALPPLTPQERETLEGLATYFQNVMTSNDNRLNEERDMKMRLGNMSMD